MGNISEFFGIGSQVPSTMLVIYIYIYIFIYIYINIKHTYMCFVCNKTVDCMIKPSNGRAQIQEKLQILINGRLVKRSNEERNQILLLDRIQF